MKRIAVLGLTGSIGLSVVEVVRRHSDLFHISFATTHNNYELLSSLAAELKIDKTAITGNNYPPETGKRGDSFYHGQSEVLSILASEEFDLVINAISGSAGLIYSHHILSHNHILALANKESLVMAGHLFQDKIKQKRIIPIDSEHSALFQLFSGLSVKEVRKVVLTASGGPFRELPLQEFTRITPEQALQHPTWSMGSKISIDSATMFNKGLEIIEAHWLFQLPYERISAVIHPQSIIHSLVECSDGSILAQLSNPTMQLPILYALSYPHHIESDLVNTRLIDLPSLTFSPIDPERYPLCELSRIAGKAGGIMPTVLNAANEAAVKLFLDRKISYLAIRQLVEDRLNKQENIVNPDLETVLQINDNIFQEIVSDHE
jgi:1-deoxy-D-xylulose-5-phosphate reductoisomerase